MRPEKNAFPSIAPPAILGNKSPPVFKGDLVHKIGNGTIFAQLFKQKLVACRCATALAVAKGAIRIRPDKIKANAKICKSRSVAKQKKTTAPQVKTLRSGFSCGVAQATIRNKPHYLVCSEPSHSPCVLSIVGTLFENPCTFC